MRPEMAPVEEEHIKRCTPEMRDWYEELKDFMLSLAADVEVRPIRYYVGFWRIGENRPDRILLT